MMSKKELQFRDPVVERVVDKFISRSDIGYKKYGVTLEDDKSNIFEWVNHLQEELMDAVLYLQKLKETSTEELQEALLKSIEVYEEKTL
jgi:hypothetical protein